MCIFAVFNRIHNTIMYGIHMLQQYYKYPRTPHLPWSLGATSDDVFLSDIRVFSGCEVVVTEKLDGENTSMYSNYIHARSLDSRHHSSRNWVKAFHATIAHAIPAGWRLCGENLYARHSIAYDNLPSYFILFSVWNEHNHALSWADTVQWATSLDVALPRELYRGIWNEQAIQAIAVDTTQCEGYVLRTAQGFAYKDFSRHVAKWVRAKHVQTDTHWMHTTVVPNTLVSTKNGRVS